MHKVSMFIPIQNENDSTTCTCTCQNYTEMKEGRWENRRQRLFTATGKVWTLNGNSYLPPRDALHCSVG